MRMLVAVALLAITVPGLGADPGINNLAWLSGCWVPPDSDPGSGEHWTVPADGSMIGVSRTLRNGKMVAFEFMQFRTLNDGSMVFIAQPSGRPPTTFRLKAMDDSSVVFENLEHDFPQRVIYRKLQDGSIIGRIEGTVNGRSSSVDYPMSPVDCSEYFRRPARR